MKQLIWSLLFLAVPALAENKDPRPEMHVLAQEISLLHKYMLTDASFSAPENSEKIQASLGSLNKHLKSLKEESFKGDPSLKTNAELLASHMAETEKLFNSGKKLFARYMLQSSMQMCIACHTTEKSLDFALPENATQGLAPLEKANFYFATRQFEKGKEAFISTVDGFPGNKLSTAQIRGALLSLAVFYARVKENPKEGAAYFSKVAEKKGLPTYLQSEVKAWAQDFKAWSQEGALDSSKFTEVQMLGQARKLLSTDDFSLIGDSDRKFHIRRLRATALLHKVLVAPGGKSPTKAQAILLLGQIYNRISYNLFFRFGEMYLKACIRDYKKTKTAKECYDALEQAVAEGYSGSSGMNIPEDEQVELFQLRRLAY